MLRSNVCRSGRLCDLSSWRLECNHCIRFNFIYLNFSKYGPIFKL